MLCVIVCVGGWRFTNLCLYLCLQTRPQALLPKQEKAWYPLLYMRQIICRINIKYSGHQYKCGNYIMGQQSGLSTLVYSLAVESTIELSSPFSDIQNYHSQRSCLYTSLIPRNIMFSTNTGLSLLFVLHSQLSMNYEKKSYKV